MCFSFPLGVCASGKVLSAGEKLYLEKSLVAVCAHAGSKVVIKVNLKVKNEKKNVVKFVGHTITNGI